MQQNTNSVAVLIVHHPGIACNSFLVFKKYLVIMPHHHLEGMQNQWHLVRETFKSQIYRVRTPGGLSMSVDIHYTPPLIVTISIVVVGTRDALTDGTASLIFQDIENIVLRRGNYTVVDYTLSFTPELQEGNYEISEETRKAYGRMNH